MEGISLIALCHVVGFAALTGAVIAVQGGKGDVEFAAIYSLTVVLFFIIVSVLLLAAGKG